jgi:hypothetical protein
MRLQNQKEGMTVFFLAVVLSLTLTITNCDGDSDSNACLQVTIPIATITVDGDITDWVGIAPALTDPQGDDSPGYTGDDIQAIYLARDTEHLYLRMDLWENVNWDFGNGESPYEGRYVFTIQSDGPYSDLFLGIGYEVFGCRQWTLGCNGSNGERTPADLQGPEFVGVRNNVIELRLPFAIIGNPTSYYSIMGMVQNCCATPSFLDLDQTVCVKSDL